MQGLTCPACYKAHLNALGDFDCHCVCHGSTNAVPENCYKCTPEAFGEFRPYMSSQLCERHKEEEAQRSAEMAKEMSKTVPIQKGALINVTTTSTGEYKNQPQVDTLGRESVENHTGEPQTESWTDQFYKEVVPKLRLREESADGTFSEQAYLHNFIGRLLSKTRQEERQRVVRIAEGMKKTYRFKFGGSDVVTEAKVIAWNTALTDLSSRVLEEGKE